MSEYVYSSLGPNSIRLLRLLPHEQEDAPIQCQLFHYSLEGSGNQTHLYTALSYVWGNLANPRYISIAENTLPVTRNLYKALLRLRNSSFERIIWVDAVCINQESIEEKEQQIRFMAKIYGQARSVLVWLGEAADNSDQAIKEIRATGSMATKSPKNPTIRSAVLALLQRTWFQRIWVCELTLIRFHKSY
jgi:hypothetical protein